VLEEGKLREVNMRSLQVTVAAITLAAGVLLGIRADGAEEPVAARPAPATAEERAAAAERRAAALEGAVRDLSVENAQLQLKNRSLKLQLKRLQERQPVSVIPPAPQPGLAPQGDRLPEGSVQREYNGITYYVIPLSGSK
jgi:hypothetical protein